MRCAEARDKLAAYVDGSMSEPEAMRLLDHTAECAACRARLEDLEVRRSRIAEALRGATVEPPDVEDSVMTRLPAGHRPVRRWAWAYAVAAACAVIALAACLMSGPRPQQYTAEDTQIAQPEEGVTSYRTYGQTIYVLPANRDSETIDRPPLGVVRNRGPEREFIIPQGG